MTVIPWGSTGSQSVTDHDGGFAYVGGSWPSVVSSDDADTTYLQWTTPNVTSSSDSYLYWVPAATSATSAQFTLVARHPAGDASLNVGGAVMGDTSGAWSTGVNDVAAGSADPTTVTVAYSTYTWLMTDPNYYGTTRVQQVLASLAAGTLYLKMTFASFSGALGSYTGDTLLYTYIALVTNGAPMLRHKHRDDGLGNSMKRLGPHGPTSQQLSIRRGPRAYQ